MKNSLRPPPLSALLNEAIMPLQFSMLLLQAPFLAMAPRGRGERVLVWPGFGAGNSPTTLLRSYLGFLGYRAKGWSLGGYMAREVARDCPDLVKHVVTLGSPVVGGPKYTAVASAFGQSGESMDDIERLVEERYETPLSVPVTAIYSKADGVVAWQARIDDRSPNVEHVEIFSPHTGLGFSPQAYRVLADRLASSGHSSVN